jgi:hypothetical protein
VNSTVIADRIPQFALCQIRGARSLLPNWSSAKPLDRGGRELAVIIEDPVPPNRVAQYAELMLELGH